MSNNHSQPVYDPLPLTGDDHPSTALYNAPPSPDPRLTSFNTPQIPMDPSFGSIPPGAAQPRFMGQYTDSGTRESFASSSSIQGGQSEYGSVYALNDANSNRLTAYRDDPNHPDSVPMSPVGHSRALNEKEATYEAPRKKSRRKLFIIGAIVAALLIIAAIIIAVYFTVIKPKTDSANSSDRNGNSRDQTTTSAAAPSASSSAGEDTSQSAIVTGGDGSVITMEDGTTFTYRNAFGGHWYYDPNDPFNNGAKAQSWTPALNESFEYGTARIRGVNVGGWLNTEPFISPAIYERYQGGAEPVIDEMGLSEAMRADTANGGISQLEDHYRTFITEQDFAEIAGAGLNYIRLPIGFWAVETRPGEPFLQGVSWGYFLKAIKWARKYGLRINLDLHAVPGSQNGWNHSGKLGTIGFLNGPMGYANAQRTLDIIRVLAEFISQPQYKDVVTMFGILNEPLGEPMGRDQLTRFYMEAYNIIRRAGGVGEGNGPWISLHDGFLARETWAGIFPNGDRLSLDTHPYLCFNDQSNAPMSSYAMTPCTTWGHLVNNSMTAFGLTNAGEWSNAVTDCGLYLNGVGLGTRYEGTYAGTWPRRGDCSEWTDWTRYTPAMKNDIRQFSMASMDALQHYFFWTWKIGDSLASGRVETPAWSYQLGLREGWIPADPREADGICGNTNPWQPPLAPWQTGGVGAGDIPAAVTDAFAWPPAVISNAGAVELLPQYTQTGAIPTLTHTPITAAPEQMMTATVDLGNGWNNPADNLGYVAEIAGCSYLDPWVTPDAAPPPACSIARREAEVAPGPQITTPPS
ncbi:exo-beta-1,3-glucanase [Coprinopsis marcescibilis]|uniref:glucan 1,3-beta-glucosidase n=1 Tax=Coprinopsis marcescibilis TaxID=230819 RepID=A0A5C3L9V6_COPMA|nr:exo-beta-1,3-glucanase [Coprinopsis marcescibilis]